MSLGIGVLVFWKLKPNPKAISDCRSWWREHAKIADDSGLLLEMIGEPMNREVLPFPATDFRSDHDAWWPYNTIGVWDSYESFEDQVGQYIKEGRQPFEAEDRTRSIIVIKEIRVGQLPMPDPTCD